MLEMHLKAVKKNQLRRLFLKIHAPQKEIHVAKIVTVRKVVMEDLFVHVYLK
jgi:hypothetical protein